MSDILPITAFERALERPPGTRPFTRQQKMLANLGIVLFVSLATALGMAETDLVPASERPLWRAWGAPFGMFQWWKVFGDVRTVNLYSTATIEYQDGTLKYYEFPRAEQMSLPERYLRAPENIFFNEQMPNLHNKKILPAVARFLARSNYECENPPAYVIFEVYSASIPEPNTEAWNFRDRLPHHTHRQIYFVYKVSGDDLNGLR
ncbi:MAG: hypothetical protein KGS72_28340 [Cyanobacteria bacterium REEB67]|nr:hypothetical protein [Cyanobacteria bacterium REEB67]